MKLPPLPQGWHWKKDLDGRWAARNDQHNINVYLASEPPCGCVVMSRSNSNGADRFEHGVPVGIAVAVMQANELSIEPQQPFCFKRGMFE